MKQAWIQLRDSLRKYGYSVRGRPAISQKLSFRGQRLSAMVVMTNSGILNYKLTPSTVDADEFKTFAEDLLPQLMEFNGVNSHSVIILDNCAIHHVEDVVQLFNEVGVMVHFLPPYSPDYNPIEEAFSKVKTVLKCMQDSMHSTLIDLETCIAAAIASISSDDCQQYVRHCQIYG